MGVTGKAFFEIRIFGNPEINGLQSHVDEQHNSEIQPYIGMQHIAERLHGKSGMNSSDEARQIK